MRAFFLENFAGKIWIFVACHDERVLPQNVMFYPIQAGTVLSGMHFPGFLHDDVGDNISAKNRTFCELTALYWAWKNASADYIGLCHYRRFFASRRLGSKASRIAVQKDIEVALSRAPIILPKKRNYFIETNYSQYAHAHHAQDLELTRVILAERCPEYLPAFDCTMRRTTGHRFNMLVMRRDWLGAYCKWLFDVLFELEKRLDISSYSDYDRRVFGFVAERLLDVWIETASGPYTELPVVFMEKQNWLKKGSSFLKRKFFVKNDG